MPGTVFFTPKVPIKLRQEGDTHAIAALDVTNPEQPGGENLLLKMENVLVTPHIAGWNPDTMRAIVTAAAENCLRVSRGEKPLNGKNPEVLLKTRANIRIE